MKEHSELLETECAMKDVVRKFLEKTQLRRSVCESRKLRAVKENPELSFINTKLGQSLLMPQREALAQGSSSAFRSLPLWS
jgi:hypothetical protein